MRRAIPLLFALSLVACDTPDTTPPPDDGGPTDAPPDATKDSPPDAPPPDGPLPVGKFCEMPGSIQFQPTGTVVVPGGSGPDLGFLHLPVGFCAHHFANVGNARQLRFAPISSSRPTSSRSSSGAARSESTA